ncbi:CIC11C00000003055 [Sungouiella intermedia]|uniref:CIC11C00000003055 n=1 Tax=Sungouiella intermedia TaxID=45354 RepID=A0A1L0C2D0_9ASCO|nr:CIC11C00000003055 [[Candida] intermedia]
MVDPLLDPAAPISWLSLHLDLGVFTPNILVPTVQHLPSSAKYDVVLVSVNNLQAFQSICEQLVPYINPDTLIVVESTGYVHLEPFVQLSLAKFSKMSVCSIMYESDVKRVPGSNNFLHRMLGTDHRIYVGTSSSDSSTSMTNARDLSIFTKFYKVLQMVQEDLKGNISLLKLTNPREFMTYQWKLALPRVVLNSISVIFEEPYPQNLEKQILAKPLITGLVNEVFKVIKKMDCKLVKGFENESNLLKNWQKYFPVSNEQSTPLYAESNSLFYRFYHQQEIDVDLLLLQPILLGDDHGVRTPYLENLYSILCQLNKMNIADNSLFFTRKVPGYEGKMNELNVLTGDLANLRIEKQKADSSYQETLVLLKQIEGSISQKRKAHESAIKDFELRSSDHQAKLLQFDTIRSEQERAIADMDARLQMKHRELDQLNSQIADAQNAARIHQEPVTQPTHVLNHVQHQNQAVPSEEKGPVHKEVVDQLKGKSVQVHDTPDLSDLSDIAIYGAALNGEQHVPKEALQHEQAAMNSQETGQDPARVRELELERREQMLIERERDLEQARMNMGPDENYNGNQNYNGGYNGNQNFNGNYNGNQNFNNNQNYNGIQNYNPNPNTNGMQTFGNNYSNNNYAGGYGQQANGNVNYGNNYNGRSQSQAHSLTTGQRPPTNDGYFDQKPPHGLPSNGFPQNTLPSTLRNPQRYQNGQQPQHAPNSNAPRQRLSSMRSFQDPNQMGMQQQYQSQAFGMNQMNAPQQMSNGPHQMQGNGSMMNQQVSSRVSSAQGYQSKGKNRRSAFPDQALNIDYGGRGGMPMPAASSASNPGAPANKNKHRSMMPGQMGGATSPSVQQRKSMSGVPVMPTNNLLRPPQTGSESASNSSNMDESPKTSTPDSLNNITIEVPAYNDAAAKPLGGLAPTQQEKKKKKGFLRKG